jgi:hypothetical protein
MAAGSVTVAALRHRPRQAVLVVVLAAVVTGSAALGPLYARAVEQSVLRTVIADAAPGQSALVVTDKSVPPASPAELGAAVRAKVPPQFGAPIGGAQAPAVVQASTGDGPAARTRLVSRDRLCGQVTVTEGDCVRAPGEVLFSRRSANRLGLQPGSSVLIRGGDPKAGGVEQEARVVGLYDAVDTTTRYWAGRGPAPAVVPSAAEKNPLPTVDDVFTVWETLGAETWPELSSHVDFPMRHQQPDLRGLAQVNGATKVLDDRARTLGAAASSGLEPLLDSVARQRDQARTVIPLLAVQLAVLGAVVLTFVCAAATEQRRPEIALARLRGNRAQSAAAMILRELGLLVAIGAVLGTGLGWLAAEVAVRLWLEPGVELEARLPLLVAFAGSLIVGLLAIVAAGWPTVRQPLTSLLRRVPQRASALQVGLVEGAVVAAAAAGLVTALSGDGGPVALLAPGLLAIAGGLLLTQVAVAAAGPAATRAMRGGRLTWGLTGLQIARRPALRRQTAIITVACALAVFAVDAWVVADRNRVERSARDAGAAVVLGVDAATPQVLRDAVLDIDPRGKFATPVVRSRSATESGPRTAAVEPEAFSRIAQWGKSAPTPAQLRTLRPERVAPVPLPDGATRVAVTTTFHLDPLPRPDGVRGDIKPFSLRLGLASAEGESVIVDLGTLREGKHTYTADIGCEGCTLAQFFLDRFFGDSYPADVELQINEVEAGTRGDLEVVDIGPATPIAWQMVPFRGSESDAEVTPGPPLTIRDRESFASVVIQRGDQPAVTPALAVGELPTPFVGTPGMDSSAFALAPDLSGGEHLYAVTGRVFEVPRSGPRALLVDLETASHLVSGTTVQTSFDVWLASDDAAREKALRKALTEHGLQVTSRDSTADHAAAFSREGPTLALRLALLAGLAALVLGAAVLVVGSATSGGSRARDLAGLRVVGVPAATVRRAAVREHLVVTVLGVLSGSVLGLIAAQVALPEIPFFADAPARATLSLEPAWVAVGITVAVTLLVLTLVSVIVGRGVAASATTDRLREAR